MSTFTIDKDAPILIELTPRPGVRQVAIPRPKELAEKSAQALQNAMNTIYNMADRMNTLIDNLAGNPDEVEMEFGLKLDMEANAYVAKAGAEATINVSLTWKRKETKDER